MTPARAIMERVKEIVCADFEVVGSYVAGDVYSFEIRCGDMVLCECVIDGSTVVCACLLIDDDEYDRFDMCDHADLDGLFDRVESLFGADGFWMRYD